MDQTTTILEFIKRVRAMAKTGLTYSENPYDIERYEELRETSDQLLHQLSGVNLDELKLQFAKLDNYPTPKVDVRGLILKEGKVLLIREKVDGKWAMPGGWADIGYSAKENMVKEVYEESGLTVEVKRLLAVWDKAKHDHPDDLNYVYKFLFHCEIEEGGLNPGHETLGADFFSLDDLPDLSTDRNTPEQVKRLVELVHSGEFEID